MKCKTCKYEERSELVTPCRSCDDNSSEYVAIEPDPCLALMDEMADVLKDVYEDIFINENNRRHHLIDKILIRYEEMKEGKG